jgi:4-diphosphocytidyl-2-C-methyl-D-erythritol kinase
MLRRLAPAKVNLYLHVAAPDARGYHPLRSLVAFADIGDEVRLLPLESSGSTENKTPGLSIDGPFADGLSTGEDNLILKAVRRFEQAAGVKVQDHDIALTKALPIASGIGGGSADAGAVLHLLREVYAPGMEDETLSGIAGSIGADGVMCLWAKASVADGYGERLRPASLPRLPAVLINPLVECSTAAVYRGFDDLDQFSDIDGPGFSETVSVDALVDALKATHNDLQAPAMVIQPVINDVLNSLAAQPETLLARMSGSGATCFALCASGTDATVLAQRLNNLWPKAWVRACTLA